MYNDFPGTLPVATYFYAVNPVTGKYLMLAGGLLFLAGVLLYFFHDRLHWIGRLPGDIRIEKENFRFYFPVTTLIIVSIILTVIMSLIRRFF